MQYTVVHAPFQLTQPKAVASAPAVYLVILVAGELNRVAAGAVLQAGRGPGEAVVDGGAAQLGRNGASC